MRDFVCDVSWLDEFWLSIMCLGVDDFVWSCWFVYLFYVVIDLSWFWSDYVNIFVIGEVDLFCLMIFKYFGVL